MKGSTLIEGLTALSIIAIVVSAIAALITSSLNNAQFNKNKTLATKYAQQGVEIARNVRDSDFSAFKSYSGAYCLGKGASTLDGSQRVCNAPNTDNFIRKVQIEQAPGCSPNVAKVVTTVSWTDGKCQANAYCHSEVHESCLSTTNPIQAP